MELYRRSSKISDFTCDTLEIGLVGNFNPGQYDIGAIYQSNSDDRGVVYFGNQGDASSFPFIQHIDNRGQLNNIRCDFESHIRVSNVGAVKKIWIIIWDHELFDLVKMPAPFREDGLQVKIAVFKDNSPILEEPILIHFNTDTEGNFAVTPEIDLQNSENLVITNISNAYTIPGFKNYRDLVVNAKLEIIPGFVEKIIGEAEAA